MKRRPSLRREILLMALLFALTPLAYAALMAPYHALLTTSMERSLMHTRDVLQAGEMPWRAVAKEHSVLLARRPSLSHHVDMEGAYAGEGSFNLISALFVDEESRSHQATRQWNAQINQEIYATDAVRCDAHQHMLYTVCGLRVETNAGTFWLGDISLHTTLSFFVTPAAVMALSVQLLLAFLSIALLYMARTRRLLRVAGSTSKGNAPLVPVEIDRLYESWVVETTRAHLADATRMNYILHELKAPLGTMAQLLDLTARGEGASLCDEMSRGVFDRSVARMRQTLDDVTTLHRAEHQAVKEERESFDLSSAISAHLPLSQALTLWRERGGRLTTRVAPGVEISGHPSLLISSLDQLLLNATEHAQTHIALSLTGDQRQIVLAVEDDGRGVRPEVRARIFELFYSERRGGSGLGLAFVSTTAQAHGGVCLCEESALGGAAFKLHLSRG